jgi:AcrR family transcriptional regulator
VIERLPRRASDPKSGRVAGTRGDLLNAAERLFLEHGYDGVSVRAINAAAGLNPGAVHYHFGSKEGVVAALLEDRLSNHTKGLRRAFDTLERDTQVDLEAVVALAVDPMLSLADGTVNERLWAQLLAMMILRSYDVPFVSDAFSLDRWAGMVSRALPEVPTDVVRRRWGYAVTLLLQLSGQPHDEREEQARGDRDELLAFLVGGLRG